MDKTLEELKRVAKMIDDQKKIQSGKNEPIEEIKNIRRREDSLQATLAELNREEKDLNLRLKILKKKDELEKIQQRLDVRLEEDRFYEEKKDAEGYTQLREEKWAREFDDLILKLRAIEEAEANKSIDVETANEQKELLTKEIKRLVTIKSKNKAKNRLNKIGRGLKRVSGGIAKFSNEMSKFSNEMGKFGDSMGSGSDYGFSSKNSTDWQNFFKEPTKKSSTGTKRRRKSKSKKSKKGKKRKRKRSKTTAQPQQNRGMFEGF